MGSIHSELIGDELHIARTFVSIGDPNGVVTPGIIGEFYWDSDANQLYVAESLANNTWVTTTGAFDTFLELSDTPASYSGQAGNVIQVNSTPDGLEFGQALRTTDQPQFHNLILQIPPASTGLASLSIKDSSGLIQAALIFGEDLAPPQLILESAVDFLIDAVQGSLNFTAADGVVLSAKTTNDLKLQTVTGDFSLNINQLFVRSSDGFVGIGTANPTGNLTLETPSGNVDFIINSNAVQKLKISYDSTGDFVFIDSAGSLDLTATDIELIANSTFIKIQAVTTITLDPGTQVIIASSVDDTAPVSTQEAEGIGGAKIQTFVGTQDPEGNVTGSPGDHYWRVSAEDSSLFIKRSSGSSTTGWDTVFDGAAIDEFIELIDTPSSYIEQAGNAVQVNQGESGLEFGQRVDIGDSPTFNNLTLKQSLISGPNVIFKIIDSVDLEQFKIEFDSVLSEIQFEAVLDLNINALSKMSINVPSTPLNINTERIDITGGVDLLNTENPFISAFLLDAGAMQSNQSVFVLGKYAYLLSANNNSLIIFDVSDPTSTPVIVGTLPDGTNLNSPRFIYVIGTLAYIASFLSNSLSIVDVSDPSNPVLIGQLSDPTNLTGAIAVYVGGKFAYVSANAIDTFVVIDISDPRNPIIVGSLPDPTNLDGLQEIVVIDKFAYVVALTARRLSIIDISDPTNPVLTGSINEPVNLNGASSVSVNGNFAFLSAVSDRITSIDISDPSNPTFVSSLLDAVNLNGASGIMIAGNFAYLSCTQNTSLTVVDISDPAAMVIAGSVVDAVNLVAAQMPFISGKFAYVPGFNALNIIDLHGIEASTANIGNIESTNINVTRDAFIKGNLYTGGLNVGDRGINSDGGISGSNLFATSPDDDVIPVSRLRNTNPLHPAASNKFVGNRDPNGVITGQGADVYFRGSLDTSASYENKALTTDTLWFKRSVNPPDIIQINTPAEFEALATGGIIFVPSETSLTLILNIEVITTTIFVLTGGNLTISGGNHADSAIKYTGGGTLFNGGGALRITGEITLDGDSTGTFVALAGTGILFDINFSTVQNWASLGSFEGGLMPLRFVTLISCTVGLTIINAPTVTLFNVGHFGVPMAGALFTYNTNNSLSVLTINNVLNTVFSTGSVFDFDARINFDVPIFAITQTVANLFPSGVGNIFKKSTGGQRLISSVSDASIATSAIIGAVTAAGGTNTTILVPITIYFEDEIVTISGTTSYNGTFQIFNVVSPGSFNIIAPFVASETGSVDTERLQLVINLPPPAIVSGDSIKVTGTNFYNAFYTVLDVVAELILTINGNFIATDVGGAVEVDLSLDETDVRLFATDNVGISDSITLASAFVNNNSEPTTFTGGSPTAFQDLVFGLTQTTALTGSTTMARWRMIDATNGTFEFLLDTQFNGWITFDFQVESTAAGSDFIFKFEIDRGTGFGDLPDPIETLVTVDSDSQSVSKTFALQAQKGDLIKPQVSRDTGNQDITIRFATINARQ